MKIKKLGILAGSGDLPKIAIKEALRQNIDFCVYLISEENTENIVQEKVVRVSLGSFGAILKMMQKDKISHVVFLGKVKKEHIFNKNIRFDTLTIKLLKSLNGKEK